MACSVRNGPGKSNPKPSNAAILPEAPRWARFSVRFYPRPQILFLVFDVEVIFLYPWAVEFAASGRLWSGRGPDVRRNTGGRIGLTHGSVALWTGTSRPLKKGFSQPAPSLLSLPEGEKIKERSQFLCTVLSTCGVPTQSLLLSQHLARLRSLQSAAILKAKC